MDLMDWSGYLTDIKDNFYFADTEYFTAFYVVAGILILAVIVLAVRILKRPEWTRGSDYTLFGPLRFWFAVIGFMSLVVLALANPSMSRNGLFVARGPVEVIFLVGVSFSEFAQDWGPSQPSRVELAQREILNLLRSNTLKVGDKAALFVFANGAKRPVPLTDFQEDTGLLIGEVSAKFVLPKKLIEPEFTLSFSDIVVALEYIHHTVDRQDLQSAGDLDADKTLSNPGWAPTPRDNRLLFVFTDGDFQLYPDDEKEEKEGASYLEKFNAVLGEYKKRNIGIYPVGIGTYRGVRLADILGRYKLGPDYSNKDLTELTIQGMTRIHPEYLRLLVAGTGGNTRTDTLLLTEVKADALPFLQRAINDHRSVSLKKIPQKNDTYLWPLFLGVALILLFIGWLIK